MKFQANVPFKLTKMFYEKLGEQPKDKRILVICDLFTAMHDAIDNSVTFITDNKEAIIYLILQILVCWYLQSWNEWLRL